MGKIKDKSGKETIPLIMKEVTANCITILKNVPLARSNENFFVPPNALSDKFIPQENEGIFLKMYVSEKIIDGDHLQITQPTFFPNYTGRVFEIERNNIKQLVLVGLSTELNFTESNFPFLIYIPPSPQDSADGHKKKYPLLYSKTKPEDVPYFYKDASTYPYSWDWIFFQFFFNVYKLSYQLKKANKPYVFVVPLVKSFSEGLGFLNSGTVLEQTLVAIQKFYIEEKATIDPSLSGKYFFGDGQHVSFVSFSIGNSILSNFIIQNRENEFFKRSVKDFFILDPPFGNPKNRSPIIESLVSIMRSDTTKKVLLYTQEIYYINQLIQSFLVPKKITFNVKERIFSDPQLDNVFFAHLDKALFLQSYQDPLLKDVHNTFPNFFINNAAYRSSLHFNSFNGKLFPQTGFLWWAPGR